MSEQVDSTKLYIHPLFANRVQFIPLGIVSVFLGFFVDYVIVTQSRDLGSFKYYLLNQTIWAQMLEIFMIVFNPVFLSPYIAGYMNGLLQNIGSYECTVAATTLCFALYLNTEMGVTFSLANRYVFTFFPQHRKLLENKYTWMAIGFYYLCFYGLNVMMFVSLATDAETIRAYARNETNGGLESYYSEASLIYVSEYGGKTRLLCRYMFALTLFLTLILAGSVLLFVLNVVIKRKKIFIVTLTARSLVLSSIVQAVLSIVMLYTPMLLMMFAWGYNVPNSANIVNMFATLLSCLSKMSIQNWLLFCLFPTISYCKTAFLHLNGYEVLGDTLLIYSTIDGHDCLKKCAGTEACLAVYVAVDTGACTLLTMVRDVREAMECRYYIKNVTATTEIANITLNPVEQILQDAVYASNGECPDGWTQTSTACTLAVSKSICAEYAPFLKATWNGIECIMPSVKIEHYCFSSNLALKSFNDSYYCYAVIPMWTTSKPLTYENANDYCYQQTGGYLASIHSADENSYIAELGKSLNLVGIGLISTNDKGTSVNDYKWLDGTTLDFNNFNYLRPGNYYLFPFVTLEVTMEKWITRSEASYGFAEVLSSLACKNNASAVYTKV
uniref:C-type lectin domain-containing protein n=1 Tax=Panagrellus redivivus TaxID=6233 RepID=A0A7E4V7H0_PANRE